MRMIEPAIEACGLAPRSADVCVEVELTHPAAGFAASVALDGMGPEPPQVEGTMVRVAVEQRSGAIMEAARRLLRAGVGVVDIAVHPLGDPQRRGLAR